MRKTLATTALAAALIAPAGMAQAATTSPTGAATTTVTKTVTKTEDDKTGLWGLLGLLGLAGLMGGRKQPEVRTADHVRSYDRETVGTRTTTDRAYDTDGTRNHLGDGDGRLDADDFRTNGR